MPDVEKIKEYLNTDMPKIIYYGETDSTNKRAIEYARAFPESRESVIFIAKSQTAGRGRLGRSFFSDGSGLYISFLLYPDAHCEKITKFTPFAAVKLSEAAEETAGVFPRIKWVNDLYLSGKKLAGILVESRMNSDGKIDYLVCGMGINVYKTALPEEISDIAVSIEDVSGEKISIEKFAAALIRKVLSEKDNFDSEEVFSAYKSRLDTVGKEVLVIKPGGSYEAEALALNPDYSLRLRLKDGSEEDLFTGEVSVRTKNT